MPSEYAVEMNQIVKIFGQVIANDHVDFYVRKGEIHALLGENGAGKSTIMSMLSGIYRADSGTIAIHGQSVRIRSPKDAMEMGIGMVHQNFRLVQTLTSLENIVLGEKGKGATWRGRSWKKRKEKEIEQICEKYGMRFPLNVPVWQLSVGEQQRVEIVKTLYRGADIIIFDEPTSVLTPGEAELLFQTMQQLKKNGKTMIITTHKLKEVMAISDRISVMRKGKMIAVMDKEETNEKELAYLMVGKEMSASIPPRKTRSGDPVIAVQNLVAQSDHGTLALKDISFDVRHNEIVGVAGVAGNGQKQLAEVLTGLLNWKSGQIWFKGESLKTANARELIDKGVAHVPEDRMKSGLAGSLGIVDNLLLKTYRTSKRAKYGLLRRKDNHRWAKQLIEQFDVRTSDLSSPVRQLSGGNQQKLLFAREIDQQPQFMVAVHPTQGLDVGATQAVHRMLLDLRNSGSGVLLISEDLDEVMQLSDRILVMYDGQIIGELSREEADKENIGLLMAGVKQRGVAAV